MKHIILEPQQEKAVNEISKWWRTSDKPYFVLSGCAGAGKSILINFFLADIGLNRTVCRMTLTGKAANRLQELGHSTASTIHSRIYRVNVTEDEYGREKLIISLKEREAMDEFDLFIVDECSMIDKKMMNDLLSFGKPILFIGDHNQLESINGECTLLKNPDVRLEKPVRQAEGNSIISLSQTVLNRGTASLRVGKFGENVQIISKASASIDLMKRADQILVGKHETRKAINRHLSLNPEGLPMSGDKLMCKKNNWKEYLTLPDGRLIYLTNGLIGYCVEDVLYSDKKLIFRPDCGNNDVFEVDMDIDYLEHNKFLMQNKDYDKFDYAYAITTHSAQGSEFDNLLVISEPLGRTSESRRRWMYTAVTRAVKNLIIVV